MIHYINRTECHGFTESYKRSMKPMHFHFVLKLKAWGMRLSAKIWFLCMERSCKNESKNKNNNNLQHIHPQVLSNNNNHTFFLFPAWRSSLSQKYPSIRPCGLALRDLWVYITWRQQSVDFEEVHKSGVCHLGQGHTHTENFKNV